MADHYRPKHLDTNHFQPPYPGQQMSSRPTTLPIDNQQHLHPSLDFTPNDLTKMFLSTPEIDARARGYTTPELINALTAATPIDEQLSPGTRVLEDMLNVHSGNLSRPQYPFIPSRLAEPVNPNLMYAYQQPLPMIDPPSLRNRSISSSMHDQDSSNSTSASTPPNLHDELQHVPSTGGKFSSPEDEFVRKEKKRERNRQAAQKCRTRKLTRIAELQKRVHELQGKNKDLSGLAESLKGEVFKLERQLDDHRTKGCTLVSNGMLG